eukprot:gene19249-biopygen14551
MVPKTNDGELHVWNPRIAPRVRPRRAARACAGGRMGPEVGPAFQRRSRDTPSSNLGVRSFAISQFVTVGARHLGIPAFAPRSGPHAVRAPDAQMIRIPQIVV